MTVTLKYLVEHGVTRAELARQIGLAPTTVTRVLRQQRTTTVTKRKVKSYLRQLKKGTRQMPPGLELSVQKRIALGTAIAVGGKTPLATIGLPAQVGKQGPVLFLDESFTDPTQMVVSLTAWAEGARFSQSLTEGLNPAGWYPGAESKAHIASPQRLNKVLGQVGRSMKAQLLWLPFRTFQLASGKQDPLYPYLIAILARVLAINASAFTVVLDQRSDIKVEQLTADLRHLAAFIYVETGRRVTLQGLLMDSKKSLGVQTADFLAFGGMHLLMPALAAFHIRRLEYDTLIGEPLYQRYTRLHREFAER